MSGSEARTKYVVSGFVRSDVVADVAVLMPKQVEKILAAQKARIENANGDGVVPTTITRQMRRHPERFVQKHSYRPSPRTSRRHARELAMKQMTVTTSDARWC
jgi:hypothetical protein